MQELIDKEMRALSDAISIMEPLTNEERERILRYLLARFVGVAWTI